MDLYRSIQLKDPNTFDSYETFTQDNLQMTNDSINNGLLMTPEQLEILRMAQIAKLVPDWDKHPASGRVT